MGSIFLFSEKERFFHKITTGKQTLLLFLPFPTQYPYIYVRGDVETSIDIVPLPPAFHLSISISIDLRISQPLSRIRLRNNIPLNNLIYCKSIASLLQERGCK